MEEAASEIGGTEAAKGAPPPPPSPSVLGGGLKAAPEAPAADAPAGDAPAAEYEADWLKDVFKGKYRTKAELEEGYGTNSREAKEAVKTAKEAQAALDALKVHHGAPKDADGKPLPYEFEIPEGADLDPAVKEAMSDLGHELDLAPAVLNKALAKVLPWFLGDEVGRRERTEQELAALFGGTPEGFKAGITSLEGWAQRCGLGGDEQAVEDWIECGNHPAAVRTLERLRLAHSGGNMGRSTGSAQIGRAEYEALVAKNVKGNLTSEETQRMVAFLNQANPGEQG